MASSGREPLIVYHLFLLAHSWLRWLVLAILLLAVLRALLGMARKSPWSALDDRLGRLATVFLDVQLLTGLVLYVFLSPAVERVMTDVGAAMTDTQLRFWGVEHAVLMVLGVVLVHVGRVSVRRADVDAARHRRTLVWFGVALLLVLAAIPWPMLAHGRPLFRMFAG